MNRFRHNAEQFEKFITDPEPEGMGTTPDAIRQ
jgi:hypothetical protein